MTDPQRSQMPLFARNTPNSVAVSRVRSLWPSPEDGWMAEVVVSYTYTRASLKSMLLRRGLWLWLWLHVAHTHRLSTCVVWTSGGASYTDKVGPRPPYHFCSGPT